MQNGHNCLQYKEGGGRLVDKGLSEAIATSTWWGMDGEWIKKTFFLWQHVPSKRYYSSPLVDSCVIGPNKTIFKTLNFSENLFKALRMMTFSKTSIGKKILLVHVWTQMLSVSSVKVGTQKGTIININNEKVDKMVNERLPCISSRDTKEIVFLYRIFF